MAQQNFASQKTFMLEGRNNPAILTLPEKMERVTEIFIGAFHAAYAQRTIESNWNDTLYISEGFDIEGTPTWTVNSTTVQNNEVIFRDVDGNEHVWAFPLTLNSIKRIFPPASATKPTIEFDFPHGLEAWRTSKRQCSFVGGAISGTTEIEYTIVDATTITLNTPLYVSAMTVTYLHVPRLHASEVVQMFKYFFSKHGLSNEITFEKRQFHISGEGQLYSRIFGLVNSTLPNESSIIRDRQVAIPPAVYTVSTLGAAIQKNVNFGFFPVVDTFVIAAGGLRTTISMPAGMYEPTDLADALQTQIQTVYPLFSVTYSENVAERSHSFTFSNGGSQSFILDFTLSEYLSHFLQIERKAFSAATSHVFSIESATLAAENYYSLSILNSADLLMTSAVPSSMLPGTSAAATAGNIVIEANGGSLVGSPTVVDGGTGFSSAPTFVVFSDTSFALLSSTMAGGVITSVTVTTGGADFVVGKEYVAVAVLDGTRTLTSNVTGLFRVNEVVALQNSVASYGIVTTVFGSAVTVAALADFATFGKLARPFEVFDASVSMHSINKRLGISSNLSGDISYRFNNISVANGPYVLLALDEVTSEDNVFVNYDGNVKADIIARIPIADPDIVFDNMRTFAARTGRPRTVRRFRLSVLNTDFSLYNLNGNSFFVTLGFKFLQNKSYLATF